ncbi:MAG: beta-ketoacyl synthase N-terminal-like domain-containing protein [Kineosporiaceae bacterium]
MTATDEIRPPSAGTAAPVALAGLDLPSGPVAVVGAAAVVPSRGVLGSDPAGAPLTTGTGSLLRPGPPATFEPATVLGRKGLRYKDRATLLGAVAAELALRDAGWAGGVGAPRSTGVVVASCYGNLDTVCGVAAAIDAGGVRATSPMDLPNASSNVVAAVIAIRGDLRGVCLSVCNGHTGGWDALLWAGRLLASGRAPAVLAVGVETPSPSERALRAEGPDLADGAAALLLVPASPLSDAPGPAAPAHDGPAAPVALLPPAQTPTALAGLETASLGGVVDVVAAVQAVRDGGPALALPAPGAGAGAAWAVTAP